MVQQKNAAIVAEIHSEFDLAADNLLKEAVNILEKDILADKLKDAGFNSIGRVKIMERYSDFKRMAETVNYYKEKYPFYKFITPLQVKEICNKYGLYLGGASLFIGEIPDKNINEILNFKLQEDDFPSKETGWVFTSGRENNFDRVFLSEGQWCEKKEEERLDVSKQMRVCAPKQMFDLRGDVSVKDGYMIVLDPIVLHPVKGGYLIVSKWGLEASDESLVNEKQN